MSTFSLPIQVRWSDIDQNRHVRHSAYYDYGAMARISCFAQHGLTTERLEEFNIGPVLFREEAVFRRELRFEDIVSIDMTLVRSLPDFSRWTIRHQIFKGETLAAVLTLDGAWIDTQRRKLTVPNESIQKIFTEFPKAEDFSWVDPLKK